MCRIFGFIVTTIIFISPHIIFSKQYRDENAKSFAFLLFLGICNIIFISELVIIKIASAWNFLFKSVIEQMLYTNFITACCQNA